MHNIFLIILQTSINFKTTFQHFFLIYHLGNGTLFDYFLIMIIQFFFKPSYMIVILY